MSPGRCTVKERGTGRQGPACEMTLKSEGGVLQRLITSAHLSRPEHYFSIYQSGCNMECLKCHSWRFSQYTEGEWYSAADILRMAGAYARTVTYEEPKERATSFHALDLCRGCGACVHPDRPSAKGPLCPGKVEPYQVVLSPQGFGPARNIVAFTGGDVMCRPDFYADCGRKIKENNLRLWLLLETNGYGLTPQNLDVLKGAGIDAFWLDIKAFAADVHKKLTGVSNEGILKLPAEMVKRDFTLEVLTLYIPGWVEADQIGRIAEITAAVDKNIPFTILAFFPEYKMKQVTSPTLDQMLAAYDEVKKTGLHHVRLANLGVFITSETQMAALLSHAPDAV